ncbi:hypothetical protein ACSBR1_022387 [Camellia fascicularis]
MQKGLSNIIIELILRLQWKCSEQVLSLLHPIEPLLKMPNSFSVGASALSNILPEKKTIVLMF